MARTKKKKCRVCNEPCVGTYCRGCYEKKSNKTRYVFEYKPAQHH